MGRLLDTLEKYQIGAQELDDELIWVGDKDRGFSVSSMYATLCPQIHDASPGICVWNSLI